MLKKCLIFLLIFIIICFLTKDNESFVINENFNVNILSSFLNDDEIDKILDSCNYYSRSKVFSDNGNVLSDSRTSSTCGIGRDSEAFKIIKEKIDKMGFSELYIENLQLTKYNKGEMYKCHVDYFNYNKDVERDAIYKTGQRLKTIFIYLKSANLGGGTRFCKINKTFNLNKGDALYWTNCYKEGDTYYYEEKSEHEGLPVLEGEKIGLNVWLTDKISN